MQHPTRTGIAVITSILAAGCLAAVALAKTAGAEEITGKPRVVDADTFHIGDEKIRLQGIDAPEGAQTCLAPNGELEMIEIPCGAIAAAVLTMLIGENEITCVGDERGRYGRLIATCYLGDVNLNRWLVSAGWAVAYLKYSTAYSAEQFVAANSQIGLWEFEFERPEYFRRQTSK